VIASLTSIPLHLAFIPVQLQPSIPLHLAFIPVHPWPPFDQSPRDPAQPEGQSPATRRHKEDQAANNKFYYNF
jgi:hypothetical protein